MRITENKQHGYTLIELLISLSILTLLIILPTITFNDFRQSYETAYIAAQIKEDLLLAQHIAMTHGRTTTFRIDHTLQHYVIRFSTTEEYLIRSFQNQSMYFEAVTLGLHEISFLPNGNPRYSGTFQLSINNRDFQYTVYLGKGRVYYREL